jgi:hypothetical protein
VAAHQICLVEAKSSGILEKQHTLWILHEEMEVCKEVSRQPAVEELRPVRRLGSGVDDVDAILFVEYLLEGRLEGRFFKTPKLEDLSIENMKPNYAKSKVWLYDTKWSSFINTMTYYIA